MSYGSSYIEAAKPILQSSLEVASAMVIGEGFGEGLPMSASLSQVEAEVSTTKKPLPRSKTVGEETAGEEGLNVEDWVLG